MSSMDFKISVLRSLEVQYFVLRIESLLHTLCSIISKRTLLNSGALVMEKLAVVLWRGSVCLKDEEFKKWCCSSRNTM